MHQELKQTFLKLLQCDADNMAAAARAWEELDKQNARLEDLNGKQITTAAEMAASYRSKEKELRVLIAKVDAQ